MRMFVTSVFSRNFLPDMVEFEKDASMKVLIEDVRHFEKFQDGWMYKISEENLSVNVSRILIQGEIIKTAGFSNEILIMEDGTGKAKVTRGPQVPGDLSWISSGLHCSVVGTLLENGKLPLIQADKIAKITNRVLLEMWPWEVQELKEVMANRILPRLPEDSGFASNGHF